MIWFTSDQHFFHKNIIDYCNRPFSDIDQMNYELIKRWNSVVDIGETVWILGDFSFSKPKETNFILDQLNGEKFLIKGNHDHSCSKWKVSMVTNQVELNHLGNIFILCHYPYYPEEGEDNRFLKRRPKNDGQWLLHGHVHNSWKKRGKMINVGVDVWDYYPVNIEQILELIRINDVDMSYLQNQKSSQ